MTIREVQQQRFCDVLEEIFLARFTFPMKERFWGVLCKRRNSTPNLFKF
jgi:hypothetical protein